MLSGAKGGEEKPRQPKIETDNLQSVDKVKMLLALGEGEFRGELNAQSIFLDSTPLADPSGNLNFSGVRWEFRPGTQHQSYIQGFPAVENEIPQSVELTSSAPYVRAVTNTQLSAIRIRFNWPALQQQQTNGDVTGYAIAYAIDVQTDGGAYQEVLNTSVSGKTTSGYSRSHRVELPDATSGWQIRVRRLTANAGSSTIADTMNIVAFTEIIDSKLRYPNTALLYIEFDARQFTNIPKVTCEPYGRIWQVPTNYDPITRTYSGVWDGSFKSAWTDNPAWVTYGVITNERFGLGNRVKPYMVDKWELYRIAQYCDQLVPDGKGGLEPRFICNIYIQSKAEAWTVLRDLAAIYRGMTYWANSQMVSIADMPRDVDYTYTRANVVNGQFTYSSSRERTRYTRTLVSYDNPDNGYQTDVVAVNDINLQRRYGDNPLEITAIGCTRESEAQRRGKWTLLTNSKDRTVTFQVGLDGQISPPGYIIGIADPLLAGRAIGGRVSTFTAPRTITLDRDHPGKAGDLLYINLPSGKSEARTISSVAGRSITVTVDYSEVPQREAQWAIDADDLAIQQYRVVSLSRDDNHLYTITATQHDPSKYDAIDTGARLEDRPITVIPPSVQVPPTGVELSTNTAIDQTMAVTSATIKWNPAENAVAYEVEWQRDRGVWVKIQPTGNTEVEIVGIYAGQYLARVRAINAVGVKSAQASSMLTELFGKQGEPPAPSFLTTEAIVFGIRIKWGIPAGAEDTQFTEVEIGVSNTDPAPVSLGLFAAPTNTYTNSGMAAGVTRWFRARLIDRTGNIGPWTAWVFGQSSADANEILDYLTGQITETELAGELTERIETGETAAVQVSELAEGLEAMWSVKLQVNDAGQYVMAGIGLGIENVGGSLQSSFYVLADNFAILNSFNGTLSSPFIVTGGQTIINSAIIGNATIGFAKIADDLQSTNYVAGTTGWRLRKNGDFEINGSVPGQGRMTMNNRALKVFDAAGVVRVQVGDLTA